MHKHWEGPTGTGLLPAIFTCEAFLTRLFGTALKVMLGSLWAELSMDLPPTVSGFLLSPLAQPEQLPLQRGALVPLRLWLQGVWAMISSQ